MGLGDKVPSSMIITLALEGSEVEGESEGDILGIISLPGKRAKKPTLPVPLSPAADVAVPQLWQQPRSHMGVHSPHCAGRRGGGVWVFDNSAELLLPYQLLLPLNLVR